VVRVQIRVNGQAIERDVADHQLLLSFLRDDLGLTGTHSGCDTSHCGCCTVHLNGAAVKACSILTAQAHGAAVVTIEGLAQGNRLHPMQEAFSSCHALQCGFCTPGMIMASVALVRENAAPSSEAIIEALEGNLCRCTGYVNIVKAVKDGARRMRPAAQPADTNESSPVPARGS